MPAEPAEKRVVAFFDGQHVFHAALRAFGYPFLNCDPLKLAKRLCADRGDWKLQHARFYTGVPSARYDPALRGFWQAKLAQMGRQGIITYSRDLKYSDVELKDDTGRTQVFPQPREKGVDVRIAIDAVVLAYQGQYDVALVISQDQDFSELVKELRNITNIRGRWLRMACAFFPDGHDPIHGAEPIEITRAIYDACLDPRDYRPAMAKAEQAAIDAGIYRPSDLPFNPPRFKA